MTKFMRINTLGGESFLIKEPYKVHTYATRKGIAYEVFFENHAVGFYPCWYGLEFYSLGFHEKRAKLSSRVQNRKEVEAWLLAYSKLTLAND